MAAQSIRQVVLALSVAGLVSICRAEPATTQPAANTDSVLSTDTLESAQQQYDQASSRCLDALRQTDAYKEAKAAQDVALTKRTADTDGDIATEAAEVLKTSNLIHKMETTALANNADVVSAQAILAQLKHDKAIAVLAANSVAPPTDLPSTQPTAGAAIPANYAYEQLDDPQPPPVQPADNIPSPPPMAARSPMSMSRWSEREVVNGRLIYAASGEGVMPPMPPIHVPPH